MKLIFILTAILGLSAFAEAPKFSAFSDKGNLYVTILGDNCNKYAAQLDLAPSCEANRWTMDYTTTCKADLRILSTRRACREMKKIPVAMTLNLKEQNVTKEAEVLMLKYAGVSIKVLILNESDPTPTAEVDYKAIYEALKVKEYNQNPNYGSMHFVKKVGGLECSKTYTGEFIFDCHLDDKNRADLIYKALNIDSINVTNGRVGVVKLQKAVGGLTCISTSAVSPQVKPQFKCELK